MGTNFRHGDPSIWRKLRADRRFYLTLCYPAGCGALRRSLSCLHSRGLLVLAVHRITYYYNALRSRTGWTPRTLALRMLILVGRALTVVLAKSDIGVASAIDGGVYLSDRGYLIIAPRRLGRGTVIHHRVTIGAKAGGGRMKPTIGENVWIGPDCVIYGDLTIGDGATVLPDTVLSMNVAARAVVAGNPARIVATEFDNSNLRRGLDTRVDRAQFAQSCTRSAT